MASGTTPDPATAFTLSLATGSFTVWDLDAGESQGNGPVREVYSRQWDESRADWHILCNWDQRVQIAAAMLGGSTLVNGKPVYSLPAAWPYAPTWICKRIEAAGHGKPHQDTATGLIAFDYAKMRLQFGQPDWEPDTALVSETHVSASATAISLDPTTPSFKLVAGGQKIPPAQIPSVRVTTLDLDYTLYNRTSASVPTYLGLVDNTNNASFLNIAAGKLLYLGPETIRTQTVSGQIQIHVQHRFAAHPQGWNYTYVAGTGWAQYTDLSGNPFYTSADFSPLLSV